MPEPQGSAPQVKNMDVAHDNLKGTKGASYQSRMDATIDGNVSATKGSNQKTSNISRESSSASFGIKRSR